MVEYYLQNLNDFSADARVRWMDFERAVKENRLETKFNNLVKASYMVPDALAQKYYENKNTKASADVIALRYASIPDSTVVVTDKDNKAFYEENKYRYETDERRDIEYVVFDIKPSLEDRQDALKYVQSMKEDFTNTDNVINFVNANSDKRYDSTWVGRNDVPKAVEASVFDLDKEPGYVYGPYEDNNAFNLVRIVDLQSRPDSLRASHILIAYKGAYNSQDTITKEEAETKANELLAQLQAAKNNDELFAELATANSSDPGSKEKGGDLDWFTDGRMVPQFNEFVVNNP
jgi:peptidyl-prolyl cis-trans isomerase D